MSSTPICMLEYDLSLKLYYPSLSRTIQWLECGVVVKTAYKDNPASSNNKENNSLPEYLVVDFPHLDFLILYTTMGQELLHSKFQTLIKKFTFDT